MNVPVSPDKPGGTACELVFGLPVLHEGILSHVIHDYNEGGLSVSDILSCRLVNKSWLQSTTNSLAQTNRPVINIKLCQKEAKHNVCHTSSSNGSKSFSPEAEIWVTRFSETGAQDRHTFPPFSLTIFWQFFKLQNYPILLNLFTTCGDGLVEIKLECDGCIMSVPSIPALHKLHKLSISLVNDGINPDTTTDTEQDHTAAFIQSILDACKILTVAEFDLNRETNQFHLEELLLPPTLTAIKLYIRTGRNEWHVLSKSRLPNLTHLDLHCMLKSSEGEEISRILENVGATLQTLKLILWETSRREGVVVEIPVMSTLKNLAVHNDRGTLYLRPGQDCLPNLRTLHLWDVSISQLEGWTRCGVFCNVAELKLRLSLKQVDNTVSLEEAKTMKCFWKAVPNLQKLELLDVGHVDIVRGIFEELTKLTHLNIRIKTEKFELWDALLIGVPAEMLAELRKSPNVDLPTNTLASIRNLTELCFLTLSTWQKGKDAPVVTDISFQFAFLKMPKLRFVRVIGPFRVSNGMRKKWRDQGRQCFTS